MSYLYLQQNFQIPDLYLLFKNQFFFLFYEQHLSSCMQETFPLVLSGSTLESICQSLMTLNYQKKETQFQGLSSEICLEKQAVNQSPCLKTNSPLPLFLGQCPGEAFHPLGRQQLQKGTPGQEPSSLCRSSKGSRSYEYIWSILDSDDCKALPIWV